MDSAGGRLYVDVARRPRRHDGSASALEHVCPTAPQPMHSLVRRIRVVRSRRSLHRAGVRCRAERRAGRRRVRSAARTRAVRGAEQHGAVHARLDCRRRALQIGTRYRFGGTPRRADSIAADSCAMCSQRSSSHCRARRRSRPPSATSCRRTPPVSGRAICSRSGAGNRVTHIGIYVGDGRYVHASPTAGRVIETSLARTTSPSREDLAWWSPVARRRHGHAGQYSGYTHARSTAVIRPRSSCRKSTAREWRGSKRRRPRLRFFFWPGE
jgi:hypothetical protein